MKPKEAIYTVLNGQKADRCPVTVPYTMLYYEDHYGELTGNPQWQAKNWLNAKPENYVQDLSVMISKVSFDIIQPWHDPLPRCERENIEYFEKNGEIYLHKIKEDDWERYDSISGFSRDYHANQTQLVFDKNDVDNKVPFIDAKKRIASGLNDYIEATVKSSIGQDYFILSGGVLGAPYGCHFYVGLTNLFMMMLEKPDLIEYLSKKLLANNIEEIRRLAAAGGDAIYIDDATSTNDVISTAMYERFSLPYMCEMVREIHNLGHKAILVYFGGISDRLEQIASIGADALIMEASMKNYVNEIERVVDVIGDKMAVYGNINPVDILENGTDVELEMEMKRQFNAGQRAKGFIMSTGSPVTPTTPCSRVNTYLQIAKRL